MDNDTFSETIDGLNRAVEWVRTHLAGFTQLFTITSSPGLPVEISFGCMFGDAKQRREEIEKLFSGRNVTRTTCGTDLRYSLFDEEWQIAFRWHVYGSTVTTQYTEAITL